LYCLLLRFILSPNVEPPSVEALNITSSLLFAVLLVHHATCYAGGAFRLFSSLKNTADKLEGPMSGQQISDLITAITTGESYANIHTEKHPNREIRGQIR
jgi:hypothetical protein